MKNIAVEKGLTNIKDYLSQLGYNVSEFDTNHRTDSSYFDQFDCVITAGLDDNMMGIDDTTTKVPMINANGLTEKDVKNLLDQSMKS